MGARRKATFNTIKPRLTLFVLVALLSSCTESKATKLDVAFVVSFKSTQADLRVENLSAIVGGEKLFLGTLKPDEPQKSLLRPGPKDDLQFHLMYFKDGKKRLLTDFVERSHPIS